MTRTQKLNLFTWQLSDPVDLSQMNENFDRLDRNGCRTEAALWNSAIGLLAAEHAGYRTDQSESAFADALRDGSRVSSYENLYFGQRGAELLSQGASSKEYHLDPTNLHTQPVTLTSAYTPEGYATLTKMLISGTTSIGGSITATLYLCCGNEVVAQGTCSIPSSSQSFSANVSFQYRLDPNKTYSIKGGSNATGNAFVQITHLELTLSPLSYTAGSLQTVLYPVPSGAARLRLMCTTSGSAPTVQYAGSSGDWTSLTLSTQAVGAGNLHTAQLSLPSTLQAVRLKFTLSGAGNQLRDYAFILF